MLFWNIEFVGWFVDPHVLSMQRAVYMGPLERLHNKHLIASQQWKRFHGPRLSRLGVFCVQVSFTGHLSTYFLHDIPSRIMKSDWVWFLSVIDKGKGGGPGGILWECGPARLFAFSCINVGSSSRKKGRKGHLAGTWEGGPRAVSRNCGIFYMLRAQNGLPEAVQISGNAGPAYPKITAVTRSVTELDTARGQALPWRFPGPKVFKTNV